jgi:hypothetical protein
VKRTITIRVEVANDEEYADVIAHVTDDPSVLTWHVTGLRKRVKDRLLSLHGIETRRTGLSGHNWVMRNSKRS